jgi:hypothetical protein
MKAKRIVKAQVKPVVICSFCGLNLSKFQLLTGKSRCFNCSKNNFRRPGEPLIDDWATIPDELRFR